MNLNAKSLSRRLRMFLIPSSTLSWINKIATVPGGGNFEYGPEG
jgi:hypothetical protein